MRKATPNRSLRLTWEDGTSVEVHFTARANGRSSAAVQHRKLPDRDSIVRVKASWNERLDALGELLAS